MKPVIELCHLTKTYPKNSRGVNDLSLSVYQGDIFGFIGPNGAGKSTTIRTLLGYISPTSGEGKVFGLDIRKDKGEILQRVGYMPSEAMFYRNMKVKDVIRLSADLREVDCSKEAQRLINLFELDVNKKIDELSLGNRKKVSMVCAFQHQPELYILDEPTSGLDPLMQNLFWKILMERHQQGATIFVSSHVLSEVKRYCQQAAIIKEGEIIKQDSIENLSKSQAKKIVLHGTNSFEISGMSDIHVSEHAISFLYHHHLKDLLTKLSQMDLVDVSISDPELEDIFMHYYESEDQHGHL